MRPVVATSSLACALDRIERWIWPLFRLDSRAENSYPDERTNWKIKYMKTRILLFAFLANFFPPPPTLDGEAQQPQYRFRSWQRSIIPESEI